MLVGSSFYCRSETLATLDPRQTGAIQTWKQLHVTDSKQKYQSLRNVASKEIKLTLTHFLQPSQSCSEQQYGFNSLWMYNFNKYFHSQIKRKIDFVAQILPHIFNNLSNLRTGRQTGPSCHQGELKVTNDSTTYNTGVCVWGITRSYWFECGRPFWSRTTGWK